MESRTIKVRRRDGTTCDCVIEVSTHEPWRIALSDVDAGTFCAGGNDLFSALKALRKELEALGMILLVNGSRKHVVCSGMSRAMGGGRKAYVVRLGQSPRRDDVVDIFDYANEELVVSTDKQQLFYEQWIESLE